MLKKGDRMNLGQRDKHSIAWFVLAQFVRRGEKERALAMYRLLMHNIENPAFTTHLEGDLLASFQDPNAAERYKQAAVLYTQRQQFDAASNAYERLVLFAPYRSEYIHLLLQSYNRLDNWLRAKLFLSELVTSLVSQDQHESVQSIIQAARTTLQSPENEAVALALESLHVTLAARSESN